MNIAPRTRKLALAEFVTLTALMVSLVALSIDAMLPALPEIGADLGVGGVNNTQLVVSALLLGLAVGQLLYGPLSDSFGRKPLIYIGFTLFILGCLLSMFAATFEVMLVGRLLQGFGAAGPRIVTIALVRDQYEGRLMARVMSSIMAVFILIPMLAPALGQGITLIAHWRMIFATFLGIALVSACWFAIRQPETLPPARRTPFTFRHILGAVGEVCTNRSTVGHMTAMGLVFGAFVGYLNSAQQILQEGFGLGLQFPLYFALLALAIGLGSMTNARLVVRYGMWPLARTAFVSAASISTLYLVIAYAASGAVPLWSFMLYLMPVFLCVGILFGNLNTLAMEPLGHIAGVGATVVGFISTLISVLLGTIIGQAYDGTVVPLVAGFALLCWVGLFAASWSERH
jgi:DHA1 family bicyclomycin/chloramphenicol resistance-like MFS transporter